MLKAVARKYEVKRIKFWYGAAKEKKENQTKISEIVPKKFKSYLKIKKEKVFAKFWFIIALYKTTQSSKRVGFQGQL